MSQRLARSIEFGAWVRRVRQELGLTREQLAGEAGLARGDLQSLATGRLCASDAAVAALTQAIAQRDAALAAAAPGVGDDLSPAANSLPDAFRNTIDQGTPSACCGARK